MTVPSFPNGPTNGQTYTENGVTYTWVENGAETGYWAASGENITLQSVTDSGNETTNNITITANGLTAASASIANNSVTIGPTAGEIGTGYVVANAVSEGAVVWRGIQTDGTFTSEISATGAATFAGPVTCNTATTEASADSVLATKGYVDANSGGDVQVQSGTWTPQYGNFGGWGGVAGWYARVGNMVYWTMKGDGSNWWWNNNGQSFGGLPYSASSQSAGAVAAYDTADQNNTDGMLNCFISSTNVTMVKKSGTKKSSPAWIGVYHTNDPF